MRRERKNYFHALLHGFLAFAVLAAVVLSVPAQAGVNSRGTANINWGGAVFTFNGAKIDPATGLNWFDQTVVPPADTRGSSSGVGFVLNGMFDPFHTDFADGVPWSNTSASRNLPGVTIHADTYNPPTVFDPANPLAANRIFASTDITNTGNDVFAQAGLLGQFTVSTAGTLMVTAPFTLTQALANTGDGFSFSYVDAGLALYDFNTTDPQTGQSPLLTSDVRSLSHTLLGPSLDFTDLAGGILNLSFDVVPFMADGTPFVYDFEASVTSRSAVPEPLSIVLVGCGLMGLTVVRRALT